MNRFLLSAAAALAAMSMSTAASAVDFYPGSPNFEVTGDINNGSVSADIGNSGIVAGGFTDRFIFTIDQTGLGSGTLSTSTSLKFFQGPTDLDIASVVISSVNYVVNAQKVTDAFGLVEFFFASDIPIMSGVENTLTVTGTSRGNGGYGGQLSFEPVVAVPEASTWAMMLIGFGMAGGVLRRRRNNAVRVAFS